MRRDHILRPGGLSGEVLRVETEMRAQRPTLASITATSYTLSSNDSGKLLRFTAGVAVAVTVPAGLQPGTTVELYQEGVGQLQLTGSGLTLRYPPTFLPQTADRYSSLVITILDKTTALVRGDLETA